MTSAKPSEKANDQAVHVVQFNTTDSSKPTQATVKTGTLTLHPEKNPVREGFRFDGWTLDGQPFDFQTPILQDITLTAKWAKTTDWTLSPDHGPATGAQLTISPPDRQKPYYVSVQAAGQQLVGLTGDGYIYTWTKDSTPKRVPFPAQAADGFRYLQAAAGNHWQAALGSDQRIYTRTSQQPEPIILDIGRNTKFTSISINDDLLLAMDRQGQVHAYQASDADNQNQNPKFSEQAATSLPRKAQAVTAVASGSRILIVDADGQAWYLYNSTASMTSVGLPDGAKASQITANKDQAMITDKDGRIWAWKPGETPIRADNGSQQYMQAAKVGNRTTAISRQGNMFTWNPDPQGKPGKPARLDTGTAPTLESASMDGQPLKFTRSNDSWQADIPARNPGPAAILITGRQDGQPFTRSITYTVDQTLTRDAEPRSTLTVRFDTCGGNPEPADQNFSTMYGRVKRPSPNPAREGFLFDGWFTGQVAYDFSRPVTKDLTLTARWSPANRNTKWSISPDKGSQLGGESTTITPPPDSTKRGIRFSQVSGGEDDDHGFSLAVGSDGNTYAWGNNNVGRLGDGTTSGSKANPVPVPVVFPLPPVITGVRFDQTAASGLTRGDGNSVSVLTPAHQPGTVTVSVDYTIGGSAQQPDTSLKYTYLSAGMLPQAGGEGILLALATGTISMGGVLASRRHRRETHRLLYASHE